MNKCLEKAAGKSKITSSMIRDVEPTYSSERLQALCSEWRREFPELRRMCKLLQGERPEFSLKDLLSSKIEECALDLFHNSEEASQATKSIYENAAMDGQQYRLPFVGAVLSCLYRTGVVGIKLAANYHRLWSFEDDLDVDASNFHTDTKISIHKTFHAALNIRYTN